jgi:hypothetical protein
MPAHGEIPNPGTDQDPELKQLLSELAFGGALEKLVADAASAHANRKRLDAPGLGPSQAVETYKRYYERECEKAQLRIEVFKLQREIENCRRNYQLASSPGARRQFEERCMKLEAWRAVGQSRETHLPEAPELEAQRKLESAIGSLKSKEMRLREVTSYDAEWNDLIAATPLPRRVLSQLPPPIRPIRGSRIRPRPKPAELPTNLPPAFPSPLRLRTDLILAEIVKAFPDRSKLEQLCNEIVSRLTELLCMAVREGVLKSHEAPDRLNELLHYVRVANCENDDERSRLEKAVRNADEWHAMLKELSKCEGSGDVGQQSKTLLRPQIRSPYKRAIREGLVNLGWHASAQAVATWIAENCENTEFRHLAKYGSRIDLGNLYRTKREFREQFDRDVTDMRKQVK